MMEPHATLALWDGDQLTLYTANQMLPRGLDTVAGTLQMPKEKVRLVSRYVGGGFGGKLQVHADAILAALAAKIAEPARQGRADAAAGVPRHDASDRHDPAPAARRRSRRHADRDRSRSLVQQHAGRELLRDRRRSDAHRSMPPPNRDDDAPAS